MKLQMSYLDHGVIVPQPFQVLARLLLLAVALSVTACTVEQASDTAPKTSKNSKKKKPSKSPTDTADEGDDDDDVTSDALPNVPASTTTPGEVTPAIQSTKGTGGATGPSTLKSASGLNYMINAPAGGGAHGLLVLLHGSTASNYDKFVGMMAGVSKEKDLIPVSVLAPNGQGWNEGDQVAAASRLNDLIQKDLFPKYDIDLSRVLFSGQSSGGGFLSSHFIPTFGKGYKGGAFLQCGMAPPRVSFAPDAAMKESFRLHFEITTGDTIWPESYQDATAAYTQAGIQFTKQDTLPGGHCAFDQQKVIRDRIDFILGQN
jgi:hypothetical protein